MFDIVPCLASRDRQTCGVPPSANEFCLLRGVDQQSSMGAYFLVVVWKITDTTANTEACVSQQGSWKPGNQGNRA